MGLAKPKGSHVIDEISYAAGVADSLAPTTCSCGWTGTYEDFTKHRAVAPAREDETMVKGGPTGRQEEAWYLVTRDGLTQVEAARRLGISQAGVQYRLRGYQAAMGISGPLPGYAGGDGPVRFTRVPPEVLDGPPATTSATEALVPPSVATPSSEAPQAPDEPVVAPDPVLAPGSGAGDPAHAITLTDAIRSTDGLLVHVVDPVARSAEEVPASGGTAPASSAEPVRIQSHRSDAITISAYGILSNEVDRLAGDLEAIDAEIIALDARRAALTSMWAAARAARDAYHAHLYHDA